MTDWTLPMRQTFEYWQVDPGTWRDRARLEGVTACTVTRDADSDTLGSATIDADGSWGEGYVRAYLVAEQGGRRERHPLGTFLVQTPSSSFDGRRWSASMDAYTPLTELTEALPPIGYYVPEGEDALAWASRLAAAHMRAPVVAASGGALARDFVADGEETWLEYVKALAATDGHELGLDELGRALVRPARDVRSMQPVWAYTDGDASITYPDLSLDHDLYGVPNVVEVSWSDGLSTFSARAVNEDPGSPTSTVRRGREVVHRESDPEIGATPSQSAVEAYAASKLRELSAVEYEVSYKHGYNGVRLGDCVRLDLARAGLRGVRAVVTRQVIACEEGCPVEERAVVSERLW